MITPSILRSLALALSLVLCLSQCDKKEKEKSPSAPAAAAASSPSSSTPAATVVTAPAAPSVSQPAGLVTHAAKLGIAAKLPKDTALYLGMVNVKKHVDALKQSAFYKELYAIISDKTPAPSAGDNAMKAFQQLWGDDVFMAGAADFGKFMIWIEQFNKFYNEMNFRMLMTGATAKVGAGAGGEKLAMFQGLFADPSQIDRAATLVGQFEMPPMIVGFKTDRSEEIAKSLIPEDMLKQIPADKLTVGTHKTPDGTEFRTITAEGSKLLVDSDKNQMLSNMPPFINEQGRKAIEKAMTDLQAKKMVFAWGASNGHVIFAVGKNLDHLNFVASPADSLLAKPELARMEPYMDKNLFMVAYASEDVMRGTINDQPFTPMLRGVCSAMKESPMFSNLGAVLESQLADYSPAEKAVFKMEASTHTMAGWWDRGMHIESYGGLSSNHFDYAKKLNYARLMDQPGVILGVSAQSNVEAVKATRLWVEKLFGMAYTAAQEMVKAGMGGPQGGQSLAMFDTMVLPAIKKIYAAECEMIDKGLGSESTFILDINGKMPALPGVTQEMSSLKFPRITTISEVTNRTVVADGWKKISDTINETMAAFVPPQDNASGGGAAGPGFVLPDPISTEKNGVTTWFYGLPFFAGDMLPCAAINDKVLILSTSKDAAESFAAELEKPATQTLDGIHWKLDLGVLMDWGITVAKTAPKSSEAGKNEIKQVEKWSKPFHAMSGRVFKENGVIRQSFSWELSDLVSFD